MSFAATRTRGSAVSAACASSPCAIAVEPLVQPVQLLRHLGAEIARGHVDPERRQQLQAQVERLARLPAIDQAAHLDPGRLGKFQRVDAAPLDRRVEAIGVLEPVEACRGPRAARSRAPPGAARRRRSRRCRAERSPRSGSAPRRRPLTRRARGCGRPEQPDDPAAFGRLAHGVGGRQVLLRRDRLELGDAASRRASSRCRARRRSASRRP